MSARQEKLTPKQEAFALAFVETNNASEAYRRSYDYNPECKPNTIEKRACELMQNRKVAGRVQELRDKALKRLEKKHDITVDTLTDMTLAAYDLAMERANSQTAAAVKATEFIARLHGMIVEKSERLNVNADLGDILRERLKAAKTIDHEISA